jgi:hypothetical protein
MSAEGSRSMATRNVRVIWRRWIEVH